MDKINDEYYLKECFLLAKRGIGTVSPNPLVGAIIVINNKIVGSGFHLKKGEPHAEINAIIDAKKNGINDFSQATLYCNLEPCCHTNKLTPPCAQELIKEKFYRVVISNLDPNPQVSGKGVELLKSSNILVTTNLLENEGKILNEVFFTHITKNRPFIHLKWAQSLDGFIGCGQRIYLSCSESLKIVHEYRSSYDAIMIGRETLNCDNPKLTIRHGVPFIKLPKRIVLGRYSKMNLNSHLFNDEFKDQTIIVTSDIEAEKISSDVKVVSVSDTSNLNEVLKLLYLNGINSILVEGGQKLLSGFIQNNLYDRISIFITPLLIKKGIPAINCEIGLNEIERFNNYEWLQVGRDMLFNHHKIL